MGQKLLSYNSYLLRWTKQVGGLQ